jgi:excisionase family DNA binding protein
MSSIADKSGLDSYRTECEQILDDRGHGESASTVDSVRPLLSQDLQLFTVVEVAELLGIGRSKVYELLYGGELKSVKIGGSRRVRYSDLGEYVRYLDDAS